VAGLEPCSGAVAGAIIFVTRENYLADAGLPVQLVIGAIFIDCILLFCRGVVGEIEHLMKR
jgi:branched-chain amino acid transport system permease protein